MVSSHHFTAKVFSWTTLREASKPRSVNLQVGARGHISDTSGTI